MRASMCGGGRWAVGVGVGGWAWSMNGWCVVGWLCSVGAPREMPGGEGTREGAGWPRCRHGTAGRAPGSQAARELLGQQVLQASGTWPPGWTYAGLQVQVLGWYGQPEEMLSAVRHECHGCAAWRGVARAAAVSIGMSSPPGDAGCCSLEAWAPCKLHGAAST